MQNLLGGGIKRSASKFEEVKKDNMAKAEFDEQVEERSLDVDLYRNMLRKAFKWRHIELAAVVFSMMGLVMAIIEYEIELSRDGYRGILLLHDNATNT